MGELVTTHVIPNPDSQLTELLALDSDADHPPPADGPDETDPPDDEPVEPPPIDVSTESEPPSDDAVVPAGESAVADTQTELLGTDDGGEETVSVDSPSDWQNIDIATPEQVGDSVGEPEQDDLAEPTESDQPDEPEPVQQVVDELDSMPVRQLRGMARATDGITMSGREISTANKAVLVDAIRRARGQL